MLSSPGPSCTIFTQSNTFTLRAASVQSFEEAAFKEKLTQAVSGSAVSSSAV